MLCMLLFICYFFFFKQKTAYEMRISDWSSDVCSSDLAVGRLLQGLVRAVDAFVQAGHRLDELGAALADGFRRGDRERVVEGKSVSVRVGLGGRRRMKKKRRI